MKPEKTMKNCIILMIALVFINNNIYSQERVSLNVIYEFSYVRDLAARDNPYKTNMVLSLGKSTSRYCTEKLYNNKTKKDIEKNVSRQSTAPKPTVVVAGGPLLIINKYGAIINEEVIKDIANEKMNLYASMGFKTYSIDEELPKIDWKIQPDKKVIGNYNCQKATGTFGGRVYTVWFAPDLAFRDGPWKLSGLPGLILEAQDQKKEISFVYKGISRNTDNEEKTASFLINDGCIKTNIKSYLKTKEAFEKDPETIMSAMAPNAKLAVRNLDDPEDKTAKKIKNYNPLESY